LRAKLHQKKRHAEKIQMKKAIKAQEERDVKGSGPQESSSIPLPNYLLDRSNATNAKALSSAIKNKRAEKAAKFSVPLPKVKGISEEQMFKVVKTGKKTAKKSWKRMITQPTFVGQDFTRRPVKYERFIRPMGLRYKKANVSILVRHIDLILLTLSGYTPRVGRDRAVSSEHFIVGFRTAIQASITDHTGRVRLPIISVKKNPQSPMYSQLGVLSRGTIIEVNVSELGLVTTGGKVVWGKYAQV
jgi:ribosome biogenesis protein NSA2